MAFGRFFARSVFIFLRLGCTHGPVFLRLVARASWSQAARRSPRAVSAAHSQLPCLAVRANTSSRSHVRHEGVTDRSDPDCLADARPRSHSLTHNPLLFHDHRNLGTRAVSPQPFVSRFHSNAPRRQRRPRVARMGSDAGLAWPFQVPSALRPSRRWKPSRN